MDNQNIDWAARRESIIAQRVIDWANADKSDPFAAGRVFTHFQTGCADPFDDDYTLVWSTEVRSYEVNGKSVDYNARIPKSMKH
jgi:hypothetical protein